GMSALGQAGNDVLPRGMGLSWADLSYQQRAARGTGTITFALSLVCVFLILAALYESWSLPFSVLLSVPIAVVGALAGLVLRKFEFNVYGQNGLVMLIGLAAKKAILIVEFAKGGVGKSRPLVGGALEGAKLRFRPVLMTSFAFIFGLLPLWTAEGAGGLSRRQMGTAVIAGMAAATGIAIFIIPMLFVLVERIRGAERRRRESEAAAVGDGRGAPAIATGPH